jgi:DNA (cytosine-5)-methyltransferase 1
MNGIKPKYRVPFMSEIDSIPYNGYDVVSTFSGGGGSCLGYRMAGYRVIYANEFVEEAQKTYRANHKETYLDCRDIRTVTAESILQITGKKQGEIDLFDGSPPCCAFSTAGKREKGWNKERSYSDGKSQRIEDLYEEYIRLLKGLQPKTFIAENVSGMVKGTAIGYFKYYLQKMKDCGYNVKAQLLNAKWLGVPQSRERIIFIGVRKDFELQPIHPKPLQYCYNLRDAFEGLPENREEKDRLIAEIRDYKIGKILAKLPKNPPKKISASSIMNGSYFNLVRSSFNEPSPTLCQMGAVQSCACACDEDRRFTIGEIKRITSLPDDFILTGEYRQQYERAARMVPPVMMMHIAKTIQTEVLDKCRTM